jgi:hypothetical protein
MGNPPRKQLAPCNFGRQAQGYSKPLLISAFTHRTLWSALRVYARKRIGMVLDARMVKLLIQNVLTWVNWTQATFTNRNPFGGDVSQRQQPVRKHRVLLRAVAINFEEHDVDRTTTGKM